MILTELEAEMGYVASAPYYNEESKNNLNEDFFLSCSLYGHIGKLTSLPASPDLPAHVDV